MARAQNRDAEGEGSSRSKSIGQAKRELGLSLEEFPTVRVERPEQFQEYVPSGAPTRQVKSRSAYSARSVSMGLILEAYLAGR
jgi:hypothetical protein